MRSRGEALRPPSLVVPVTALAAFLSPFMGSAFNLAVAALGAEFGAGAKQLGWVVTVYLLATAACLLPWGRVADLRGREKVFLWGIALFDVSLLACALAPNLGFLVAARLVCGVAAAMVFGTMTAILVAYSPPGERGKRLGVNTAFVYAGLSAGPFVGGVITQHLGWRWIFGASFLLGIITLILGIVGLGAEARKEADSKVEYDLPGVLLSVVGISALLYATSGSTLPAEVNHYLSLFGGVAVAGFLWWETRSNNPLLDVRLFTTNWGFALSNLAALISYSGSFATSYVISLYLQVARGLSPQAAGIVLLGQPVVQTLVSPLAGRLSDRLEPRVVASVGMTLTAVALGLMALLPANGEFWRLILCLCLLGLGFGIFSSPNVNAIMSSAPRTHYGSASSILALMRLLGQTLSMALAGIVLAYYLGNQPLNPASAENLIRGVKGTLVVFCLLSATGIPASLARGRIHAEHSA
ncbi:MAG: MFS transporter [Moorellales bacterium]